MKGTDVNNERDERDELADILMSEELITGTAGQDGRDYALAEADALIAAGYSRPRQVTTEWQSRSPEDAGDERAWMGNLEAGATYLHREHGYEVRTRMVSDWQTYSPVVSGE